MFIINYSAKIASIVSSVAKHVDPFLLGNSFIFLCQCSPQHGEDEDPVRHGAPQDAAPFLQESPGEALLFTYVRSAVLVPYLLFCELLTVDC
jgi:hypothetical protein